MTLNLVMNNNNVISGSNNTSYKYTFLQPLTILDEAEMAVSNITYPYSWFNISAANNNNKFQIYFPDSGSPGSGYFVTLQDGFYTVNDINAALQQFCIINGLYLINGSGKYVYYLTLLYNPTFYAVQSVAQFVPTSLPSGWSQPANWHGYNALPFTPILQVTTQEFGNLIGFNVGLYPTINGVETSTLSTFTPQGSIVNSLIVRCSLVDNECGFPTDVLDTIPITSSFGTNINYQPTQLKWIKLTSGVFQSLIITFVDQNLNAIVARDSNVCISILLKNQGKIISGSINEQTEGRGQKLVQRLAIKPEE
jgi:hypothetical protein